HRQPDQPRWPFLQSAHPAVRGCAMPGHTLLTDCEVLLLSGLKHLPGPPFLRHPGRDAPAAGPLFRQVPGVTVRHLTPWTATHATQLLLQGWSGCVKAAPCPAVQEVLS